MYIFIMTGICGSSASALSTSTQLCFHTTTYPKVIPSLTTPMIIRLQYAMCLFHNEFYHKLERGLWIYYDLDYGYSDNRPPVPCFALFRCILHGCCSLLYGQLMENVVSLASIGCYGIPFVLMSHHYTKTYFCWTWHWLLFYFILTFTYHWWGGLVSIAYLTNVFMNNELY